VARSASSIAEELRAGDEAAQPLDGGPLKLGVPRGGVEADKIERLVQRQAPGFSGGHLSDHEVAALDRPLEDRPWMSLRCQRPSRRGRSARLRLTCATA
jgi:hypothetical protein